MQQMTYQIELLQTAVETIESVANTYNVCKTVNVIERKDEGEAAAAK